MSIFVPVQAFAENQFTITGNGGIDSDNLNGTYVRSVNKFYRRVGIVSGEWEVEDDVNVSLQPYFYNSDINISLVHAREEGRWKFLRGDWADSKFVDQFVVMDLLIDNSLLRDNDISEFDADSNPPLNSSGLSNLTLHQDVGGGNALYYFDSPTPVVRKLFVNDNGVIRRLKKLWTLYDNSPRLIFGGHFFPLSNTSVDPTNQSWRTNNPGYTFIPNVGITTRGVMTNARDMLLNNNSFNDPDVALWDTSNVISMESMFRGCDSFNQDISVWDTSRVTNMQQMLQDTNVFNQDISGWNVDAVLNAFNFSTNAGQKGTDPADWQEAEHPSNTALGNFYNL